MVAPTSALGEAIQGMLNREWVVKVGHIYQEENQATDFMARIATSHNWGFVMIQNSSMEMLQILREDK